MDPIPYQQRYAGSIQVSLNEDWIGVFWKYRFNEEDVCPFAVYPMTNLQISCGHCSNVSDHPYIDGLSAIVTVDGKECHIPECKLRRDDAKLASDGMTLVDVQRNTSYRIDRFGQLFQKRKSNKNSIRYARGTQPGTAWGWPKLIKLQAAMTPDEKIMIEIKQPIMRNHTSRKN